MADEHLIVVLHQLETSMFFLIYFMVLKIHILVSLYSHKSCINLVKMTSLSPTIQCLY